MPSSGGGVRASPEVQRRGGQQGAAEGGEALGRDWRWRLDRPGAQVASCCAEAGQQAAEAGLRVRVVELGPGVLVQRGVHGGEQYAAGRQAGDDAEQTGDGWDAGGGAGDQDLLGWRGVLPGGGLRVQQRHLAGGGVHQAVARPGRRARRR